MHCTNSDHEVGVLLSLVQLSIIFFFFTLKYEVLSSLCFISDKSIRPTVNRFIDSALHCFLFCLLLHVSTWLPLEFLMVTCVNNQPPLLTTLLKICFLSFLHLLIFTILTFYSSVMKILLLFLCSFLSA